MNTAELLAWHHSEKMLKNFDDRIRELFDEHNIDYTRIFCRSSNVFYQDYNLYVKKNQTLLGMLLVERVKAEVDYHNPKWYRNIVFDDVELTKLAELFPEYNIKTDHDAFKLVKTLGNEVLTELQKRIKPKGGDI